MNVSYIIYTIRYDDDDICFIFQHTLDSRQSRVYNTYLPSNGQKYIKKKKKLLELVMRH
jgi:hypothetical protein